MDTRHFIVNLKGEDSESLQLGGTCGLGHHLLAFIPRISQFARYAVAQYGHDVVLPCRLYGRTPEAVTTYWTFNYDTLSSRHDRYQVSTVPDTNHRC